MGSEIYFNEVANEWDVMRKDFFPDTIRELACEYAGVKKGQKAIDFGAGTGFLSEILVTKGLDVVAIDQSKAMVNILHQKFNSIKNFKAILANGELESVAKTKFDYAFANMYLHHTLKPENAIKVMVRALRPKGKLVIIDLFKHNHDFLLKEHNDRWPGFESQEIQEWYLTAGLTNVVIKSLGENCCSKSESTKDAATVPIFIAIGEKI